MLYAIAAVLVIIVDQWVKYWVSGAISLESAGETFIPGLISLVNLHNDGAAFSFLSGGGARIYFIILTGIFTVAVILALATNFISGRLSRWSIVLVTAGGLSNCIDRVIYGYVQDMFKLEFVNFPVFNVADIFITVFCLLFVIAVIFERDHSRDYEDEFDDEDDEEEDRPPRRRVREKVAREAAEEAPKPEKAARKPRKVKRYEEEYEQYKAARAARQQEQPVQQTPAPAPKARPAFDPADPFAEWERANAKAEAQQRSSAVRASSEAQYTAPRQTAAPVQPVQSPAPVPQQAAPVQQPAAPSAPAKNSAGSGTDFSLDDILAEFK